MFTEEQKIEIEQNRLENVEFEKWRGKSEAVYHVSFLKTLDPLGFRTEQLFDILMKRLEIERDVSIMEIQSQIRNRNEEPCDCPECRAERGETETEL
jgi:hypothetical protein